MTLRPWNILVAVAAFFLTMATANSASDPRKASPKTRIETLRALLTKPLEGNTLTEYLAWLPATRVEFEQTCVANIEQDCSDVLLPALPEGKGLVDIDPKRVGKVMAGLAAQISWDVDAPNYVKMHVSTLCEKYPQIFSDTVGAMKKDSADKIFKFINTTFTNGNTAIEPCIASLDKAGLATLAARAKKQLKH